MRVTVPATAGRPTVAASLRGQDGPPARVVALTAEGEWVSFEAGSVPQAEAEKIDRITRSYPYLYGNGAVTVRPTGPYRVEWHSGQTYVLTPAVRALLSDADVDRLGLVIE